MRIRKRQRLRRKEINTYSQGIADALGVDPFRDRDDIDLAEAEEWRPLLADNEVRGIVIGGGPPPSGRRAPAPPPPKNCGAGGAGGGGVGVYGAGHRGAVGVAGAARRGRL